MKQQQETLYRVIRLGNDAFEILGFVFAQNLTQALDFAQGHFTGFYSVE